MFGNSYLGLGVTAKEGTLVRDDPKQWVSSFHSYSTSHALHLTLY